VILAVVGGAAWVVKILDRLTFGNFAAAERYTQSFVGPTQTKVPASWVADLPAEGSLHPACPFHPLRRLCEQDGTGFASSFSHDVFASQHWCSCEAVIRQTRALRHWVCRVSEDVPPELHQHLGNAELLAGLGGYENALWLFSLWWPVG
jgi:hypothetical protein